MQEFGMRPHTIFGCQWLPNIRLIPDLDTSIRSTIQIVIPQASKNISMIDDHILLTRCIYMVCYLSEERGSMWRCYFVKDKVVSIEEQQLRLIEESFLFYMNNIFKLTEIEQGTEVNVLYNCWWLVSNIVF